MLEKAVVTSDPKMVMSMPAAGVAWGAACVQHVRMYVYSRKRRQLHNTHTHTHTLTLTHTPLTQDCNRKHKTTRKFVRISQILAPGAFRVYIFTHKHTHTSRQRAGVFG